LNSTPRPTLHLLCGLPCSGKSTLAAQLERELPALRLTPDAWLMRIAGDGFDEAKRSAVEAIQLELALRALALGIDVILENGFWIRAERQAYRARARALGFRTRLYYLDAPLAELQRRLGLRNATLPPDTFALAPHLLEEWSRLFEAPEPDELREEE